MTKMIWVSGWEGGGGVGGGQPFWFIDHTFANHGLRLSLLPNNVKKCVHLSISKEN